MKIYDFRIEYQKNPRGIAVKKPRFSWKIESARADTVQKSYYLQVIREGRAVWESTKVESDDSVLIPYDGEELEEESRYQVKLVIENNHGEMAEAYTDFETGLFDPGSFQAKMITHDFPEEETACPIFYRHFETGKTVRRAWVYLTAHGVYEARLNGKRIGSDHMAPGWTSYQKRLQYQQYDITEPAPGEK